MVKKESSEIRDFCDGIEEMIFSVRTSHPDVKEVRFPEGALETGSDDFLKRLQTELVKRLYGCKVETTEEEGTVLVIDISKSGMN